MADTKLTKANLFGIEKELGGGTLVIANPPEPATNELVKIKIGEIVYNVEGSGPGPSEQQNFYGMILPTNTTILPGQWILEDPPTYSEYPYRADITVSGATADCSPDVRFNITDDFDKLAPIANAYTDKVMIYASEALTNSLIVPVIILNNLVATEPSSEFYQLEGYIFLNSSIATTDWINESSGGATPTYEDFPYRADIIDPDGDITSDYSADARFSYSDITSGIFAPVTNCDTSKIMIYASEIPSNTITIPVIICTKVA